MMDGVPTFVERQRFASNRSAVVLTAVLVAALAALVAIQAANARAAGGAPAPFWIPAGVALVLIASLFVPVVRTEVGPDDVRVAFLGRTRTIPYPDIEAAEVITYRPLRDYGGWGYRLGRNRTRAYTASGTEGLLLTLAGDRRVLIGSQRVEQLAAAVAHHRATRGP